MSGKILNLRHLIEKRGDIKRQILLETLFVVFNWYLLFNISSYNSKYDYHKFNIKKRDICIVFRTAFAWNNFPQFFSFFWDTFHHLRSVSSKLPCLSDDKTMFSRKLIHYTLSYCNIINIYIKMIMIHVGLGVCD